MLRHIQTDMHDSESFNCLLFGKKLFSKICMVVLRFPLVNRMHLRTNDQSNYRNLSSKHCYPNVNNQSLCKQNVSIVAVWYIRVEVLRALLREIWLVVTLCTHLINLLETFRQPMNSKKTFSKSNINNLTY